MVFALASTTTAQGNCAVASGAIHHWGGDGSTLDSIGSSPFSNGTANYGQGVSGQCFQFGGTTNLSAPDSPDWDLNWPSFTLEAWVNLTTTSLPAAILAHNDGGGSLPKWMFIRNYSANETVTFHINSNQPHLARDLTFPFHASAGTWHHLCLTRDQSTWTFYVDGQPNGTHQDGGLLPDSSSVLSVGSPGEGSLPFPGSIDEVAIYARSLQAIEVQSHFLGRGNCVPPQPYTVTSIAQSGGTIPPLSQHALSPLPQGGALLFGGTAPAGPNASVFTLNGTTWTAQFPLFNPSLRNGHSLLLDPMRHNNLLFGGLNVGGAALGDTWIWSSNQWTYLTPATAPAPRHGHRMAFDRVANVGLLFGGKNGTGAELSDFWSWNGTTWAQLTPATLPPARANHGMAYDELRNRTVVFGGKSGSSRLADVWEWDGSAWTNATPQGTPAWNPGARDGHAMAYDPRAERVVLHGGETASGCQQDVWSWNGSEWTIHLAQPGSVPSARTGSQLIHDNGTNRLLLFAGGCGTSASNDLWHLSLPVLARTNSYGSPCVGSNGALTLSVINNSAPILGQTLQMEMSNVPLFAPCVGFLGLSNTDYAGVPLPFSLDFLRIFGCSAYMSADFDFPLGLPNNATNTMGWNLPIPANPFLLSTHVYLQGLALELSGASRFATVTNGIDARVGDR